MEFRRSFMSAFCESAVWFYGDNWLKLQKLYEIKVIKTFISHKTSHIKNVCLERATSD